MYSFTIHVLLSSHLTVVIVGFVETLVEVNESDGQATLNVTISFPEPDPLLPFQIMFRLDATMMSITAGMGKASQSQFSRPHTSTIILFYFSMSRCTTSFSWPR